MQNYSTGGPKTVNPEALIGVKLGKYEIKDIIGRGAMGVVYKVWDEVEEEYKAIKMVPPEMSFDELAISGLKREVKASIKLAHPNIIKVLGLEKEGGVYFIVMEYVEGKTLSKMLAEKGKLTEDEVIPIMKQILEGLKEAHRNHILHLDIKPQNIMITKDGRAKILDFSISYNISKTMTMLTGQNLTTGTLPYMAPEQVSKKFGRPSEQTDIWGVGAMVYHLLSGEVPYEDKDQIIREDEEPYPLEGVSEKIKKIVMKCLTKDREKRYKSVGEVLDALEKIKRMKEKTQPQIDKKVSEYPLEILSIEDKAKSVYKNEAGVWEAEFEYGIKMVFVEGGEFLMGSPDDDPDARENEKPQHKVYLDSFWIGKYPVTFDQYDEFCREVDKKGPNDFGWGRGKRPVIWVSWNDAVEFIKWLYKKTGLKFRLPTEAEWEYAARGGKYSKGYKYSGSDNLDEVGWYIENSDNKTHPVGLKKPNELGIYDMSGNVWEWVKDWYDNEYYSSSSYKNPQGSSIGSDRVYRGGSWSYNEMFLRTAFRYDGFPSDGSDDLGFRLCLSTPEHLVSKLREEVVIKGLKMKK